MADESLQGARILSAGLGEDASFDVELAQRLGCQILIVDPTPRAVAHFASIRRNLGRAASSPYSSGGNQPVSAYNLAGLQDTSLTLIDRALASTDETVRLYVPANPADVSHSITDYQHKRSKDGAFIEVQAITYSRLVDSCFGGSPPALVKLDIEGAELEVLPQVLKKPPLQILVEFDELGLGDRTAVRGWRYLNENLMDEGFLIAHTDGKNFAYVHNSLY